MKHKRYGRYVNRTNGVLHKGGKIKKHLNHGSPLNNLPLVILRQLTSYLYGYDALGFAEFSSMGLMNSERDFWRNIGNIRFRTRRQQIGEMYPKLGFYITLPGQFIQLDSDRRYNRFIYNGFLPERLLLLMNTCESEAFQTYARLHSYSSHEVAYNMPIFSLFQYKFMYQSRYLNSIERNLFSVCRYGFLEENEIIVDDMKMFENNLNKRFGFSDIKQMINFSLFVLAGGAVLNCLLIDNFDTSLQDLDFFWIGGCWISFINAIQRFKRKFFSQILEEKNVHAKVKEFVLLLENKKEIRIQFIFGRSNANIPFILYTFDLDIVQVAYDGERIISTIGFFQAISTKSFLCYNLTNNILDTPSYVDRCLKYSGRGFTWIAPIGYNQSLAQKPLVKKKNMVDYGFDDFYYNIDLFCVQLSFLRLNLF